MTVSCINAMIAACGKAKELGRAFETFESFGELGIAPNVHSYTLLMDICLTNRRYDAVFKMSEEIENNKLDYTPRSIEILIHAAMRVRDVYLINDFLALSDRHGLPVTENLLKQVNNFIARYRERTDEEEGEELDQIMTMIQSRNQ